MFKFALACLLTLSASASSFFSIDGSEAWVGADGIQVYSSPVPWRAENPGSVYSYLIDNSDPFTLAGPAYAGYLQGSVMFRMDADKAGIITGPDLFTGVLLYGRSNPLSQVPFEVWADDTLVAHFDGSEWVGYFGFKLDTPFRAVSIVSSGSQIVRIDDIWATTVPEPGSWWLGLTGFISLSLRSLLCLYSGGGSSRRLRRIRTLQDQRQTPAA